MDTMGKVQNTQADDWNVSSNSVTTILWYTLLQRSWRRSIKTVTCRSYIQREPFLPVLDLLLIQHSSTSGLQPTMSVDLSSVCTSAEKVFTVPRASTPTPPRFPKTCVYHQGILTIHGADTIAQLIVFWSKALLRHPQARSSLEEMTSDTVFQRYIPDTHPHNLVPPNEIRRHILCTGLSSRPGRITFNIILTTLCRPGLSHSHSGASGQGDQRCSDQPS